MTNKPTDDTELDKVLLELFAAGYREAVDGGETEQKSVNQAKQAIQRLVLEGRIEELEIVKIFNKNDDAALYAIGKRLAQLRKQLEGEDRG